MSDDFVEHKDYIISSRRNLKNIKMDQLIILTVFKDNIHTLAQLFPLKIVLKQDNYISNADIIIATPLHFMQNIENYDLKTKHILIHEPDLIEDLDYLSILSNLKKRGFNFIAYASKASYFKFLDNPIIISNSVKYLITCTNNDDFYILFYILKMCLLDGSIALVTDNAVKFKKLQIFMKGIEHTCDIFLHENDDSFTNVMQERILIEKHFFNNVIMMGNNVINFNSDRVIYLSGEKLNIKEEVFDFNKVAKYKYRIDDFLRGITKNVLNGRKEFDYSRFRSMQKDI